MPARNIDAIHYLTHDWSEDRLHALADRLEGLAARDTAERHSSGRAERDAKAS